MAADSILTTLAEHNRWANRLVFDACSALDQSRLDDASHGYDSVMAILNHLVQVQNAFFELAHGRAPEWTDIPAFGDLATECARLDDAYVAYAERLETGTDDRFLVPWFGFEITLTEGVLQPLTHSHKHRADVSMLLPALGGPGVEMDLIQWLDTQRGAGR